MFIAAVELSGRITRRAVKDYSPILDYVKGKTKVGGLLLVINSEGGDANSSEILYNKVKDISSKKPVYSVIEGMGASGAYWVATASDRIYAMETSLVGSIGVISLIPNVKKLLENIGVSVEVDKIGEFKDMASPFSEMSPESREKYKAILETTFQTFRNDVKENRKIGGENEKEVFNGQIFASSDALKYGLIDAIGDFPKAGEDLAKALSIGKKIKQFAPRRPFISRMISSEAVHGLISEFFGRF